MNTSGIPPEVGGLEPPASSSQQRRRVVWDKPEPCYCKINETTGLIALSLTPFKTLHEKKPLKEQLVTLHRLHLQLDAIVTRHKAVKFSGSSESYLIAKCCDSASEAAIEIVHIVEDIMAVNKDLKGVVSFGEVGFALLGSTAWNYQFFGELVTDSKMKAEEFRPGEFKIMPSLEQILISDSISDNAVEDSPLIVELRKTRENKRVHTSGEPETVNDQFHAWWATRVQHLDVWVLVVTFILAAVSIRQQVAEQGWNGAEVPLFLQLQCCLVNLFAGFVWAVNRRLFIQNHTMIMSVVWCTQFFSRAVQAWTHVPYAIRDQVPSIWHLLLGMNGPEKLLLMTAPVNLWISGCLHWFSFVGSVGNIYRSCLSPDGTFSASPLPYNIATIVSLSFVVLFALPMFQSYRIEGRARRDYILRCEATKKKEN